MVRIKNVLVKLTLPHGQSSYKGNSYRYMASENGLFDTDDIKTNSHLNDNLGGENIQTPEQQHNSECIENWFSLKTSSKIISSPTFKRSNLG